MRPKVSSVVVPLLAVAALLAYTPMWGPHPRQVHADTPFALVLNCHGDVVVHRGGSPIKATFGFQLNEGDEIEAAAGASIEIAFDTGLVQLLEGPSKITVRPPKTRQTEQPQLPDQGIQIVQNFIKLRDAEGASSVARLRSGNKATEIRAESPAHTAIRDGYPTFRWITTEPVMDLKLTLYNEEGILWETDVMDATSAAYPADAPSLIAGVSYSWSVETSDPLQFPPLRSAMAYFEVLPVDQAKALEASLNQLDPEAMTSASSYHLVRASLFYSYGLVADAIDETRQAVAVDEGNTTLQSILAHLYAQVGLTHEAIQEYDRLLEKR
jgi:hypothetical protein